MHQLANGQDFFGLSYTPEDCCDSFSTVVPAVPNSQALLYLFADMVKKNETMLWTAVKGWRMADFDSY